MEGVVQDKWEVHCNTGWMPWAPGVYFRGAAGEEVPFALGSHKYIAVFDSDLTGNQINAQTGTIRPLRRVVEHPSRPELRFDSSLSEAMLSRSDSLVPSTPGNTASSGTPTSDILRKISSRRRTSSCEGDADFFKLGIRIVKAELFASSSIFVNMNPFAVMLRKPADADSTEMARTRTHWGGHRNPSWEHTSEYPDLSSLESDMVEFKVFDAGFKGLGKPRLRGSAVIGTSELFTGGNLDAAIHSKCERTELQLHSNERQTGTITVQALIFRDFYNNDEGRHS